MMEQKICIFCYPFPNHCLSVGDSELVLFYLRFTLFLVYMAVFLIVEKPLLCRFLRRMIFRD